MNADMLGVKHKTNCCTPFAEFMKQQGTMLVLAVSAVAFGVIALLKILNVLPPIGSIPPTWFLCGTTSFALLLGAAAIGVAIRNCACRKKSAIKPVHNQVVVEPIDLKGIAINTEDENGQTAGKRALLAKDYRLILGLLKAGENFAYVFDANGDTLIELATKDNRLDILLYMQQNDRFKMLRDRYGTPFHVTYPG